MGAAFTLRQRSSSTETTGDKSGFSEFELYAKRSLDVLTKVTTHFSHREGEEGGSLRRSLTYFKQIALKWIISI